MAEPTCVVCAELADDGAASTCNTCGGRFHLNQRNDRLGKDCGAVWIDEQHLALEFACQRCLGGASGVAQARARRVRRYRKRS